MISIDKFKELNNQFYADSFEGLEITNIECPICKHALYRDIRCVYTSFPPKYRYICKECGYEEVF